LLPMLVVLFAFRDRPARYGVTLGEWRWGLGLVVLGCALMTPIVLWFASLPDVRAYYAPSAAPLPELLAVNALELTAAEFAFRGFLMMTLLRVMGPLGVVVAALPFVFGHLGKPELELFSTLVGGLVYGWLAWRTRSILWGALGHTYILTLVTVAAAA
jgi:membrane protease YdiL (CAAX protease family)